MAEPLLSLTAQDRRDALVVAAHSLEKTRW